MIVCHKQGGSNGGGDCKEAVTRRGVGTYQGEMITLVTRKQKVERGGEINTIAA